MDMVLSLLPGWLYRFDVSDVALSIRTLKLKLSEHFDNHKLIGTGLYKCLYHELGATVLFQSHDAYRGESWTSYRWLP